MKKTNVAILVSILSISIAFIFCFIIFVGFNSKPDIYTQLQKKKLIVVKDSQYYLTKEIEAVYNQKLGNYELPKGFYWQSDSEKVVGNVGTKTFKAFYSEDGGETVLIPDIKVTIKVMPMSACLVFNNSLNKEYDGSPVDELSFTLAQEYNSKSEIVEYKLSFEDDNHYTTTKPSLAGNYTVRVKITGDNENFKDEIYQDNFSINIGAQTVVDKQFVNMITGSSVSNAVMDESVSDGDNFDDMEEIEESSWNDLSKVYLSTNDTKQNGEVSSTDLGYPVWDETQNRLLLFFGDTHGKWSEATAPTPDKVGAKHWRCNVMMVSEDEDYSDGLDITGYLTQDGITATGHAIELIKGHKSNSSSAVWLERSKLPTGAIAIDGTIYMGYVSKYKWGYAVDSVCYGGVIKSTDGGATWERVNSLSWANHSSGTGSEFGDGTKGQQASIIEEMMNEDINLNLNIQKGDPNWVDIEDHEGYFYTFLNMVDGRDGYIYIFGEGGYRSSGIKLARVKKEQFEIFEEYEYLQGYDENQNPIWLSYRKGGLKNQNSKDASVGYVLGDNETKLYPSTAMYNAYLGKWIISTISAQKGGIFFAMADNIWGPYDINNTEMVFTFADSYLLSRNSDGTRNSLIYCGFVNEHLTEDNGRVMYMIISQYSPIYQSSLVKIEFGRKDNYAVNHVIPKEYVSFLEANYDNTRELILNGEEYYCICKTDTFTSFRENNSNVTYLDAKISLKGVIAYDSTTLSENGVDVKYIIYRPKVVINIANSKVYVRQDNGQKVQVDNNISEFWVGYKQSGAALYPKGVNASNDFTPSITSIYYNAFNNYVYFGCPSGYELESVVVYKAGKVVSATIHTSELANKWYFRPATTIYTYKFDVTFKRIE